MDTTNQYFGLVLAGGKSSRMHQDKAMLKFHGKSQLTYCAELLSPFCQKVFISSRPNQDFPETLNAWPKIEDKPEFADIGPLGGILSAMSSYPNNPWIILAVDLPFVTHDIIQHLINHRDEGKVATAFISAHDQLPEPLCAIYEPKSFNILSKHLSQGKTCPRKFLINHDVKLIPLPDQKALDNINTPEEMAQAISKLKK